MPKRQNTPPGPGVDATGQAVIDPTQNVLDLVRAESRRQDDLRIAAESHAKDLREAEAKRIDAIRTVDVNAVAAARQDAEARASALAAQVANQAEAVRVGLAAALEPIQKDIADLRRVQYEAVGGRTQVDDSRADDASSRQWVGLVIAAAALLSSCLLSVTGIAVALIVKG